jgi:hypothetical protein
VTFAVSQVFLRTDPFTPQKKTKKAIDYFFVSQEQIKDIMIIIILECSVPGLPGLPTLEVEWKSETMRNSVPKLPKLSRRIT